MTRDGSFERAIFFHGGLEMRARRNRLKRKLKKLEKVQTWKKVDKLEQKKIAEIEKLEGLEIERIEEKRKYFKRKIQNINEYYVHLISRRILNYCLEQGIKVIAVPNYHSTIDFSKKCYLKTDCYEWIGRKIIRFLKYKAFSEGILVSSIPVAHISDCCSECGARMRRYNEGHIPTKNYFGGQLFLCSNGHQGNSGLNTVRNVGKKFLSYY